MRNDMHRPEQTHPADHRTDIGHTGRLRDQPHGRTQFILISPDAAIIESETAYLDTVRQLEDDDKLVNDPLSVARVARITGRLVSIAIADYPRVLTGSGASPLSMMPRRSTRGAWQAAGWRCTPAYLISLS
ncbi:MAG: hypothetical protein CM15mP74_30990 [Halieaceae bacterium]|nr:MAG: hypothetical protein CM15mP74_30990 [Halieaceae bacterium]